MSICLANSTVVTRPELGQVVTPERTATWNPVAHLEVAETVIQRAMAFGLVLVEEVYGLASESKKLFALLRFESEDIPGFGRCIGFRNSHDKTLSLDFVAGLNVFLCDNLMISGDIRMKRKHTSGLSLTEHIESVFETIPGAFQNIEARKLEMENTPFGWGQAKRDLVELAQDGIINSSSIVPMINEFMEPRHPEFAAPTEYNYLMAITEIGKEYTQQRTVEMYKGLAPRFNL